MGINPFSRMTKDLEIVNKVSTIRDVAKEANVSISTVSRYINGSGRVRYDTAARITLAIEKLHYVPSIAAQSLRNGSSPILLLVVPDICNPFYSQIAKSVQGLLRDKGYVMTLYDSNESVHELASIRIARQMNASGILLASIDVKESVIREIITSQIPVVALNAFQKYPFDTVHIHGSEGTYLAVSHLIALGHKRIGFAGGTPNTMIAQSRFEGYLRAMREANLPIIEKNIIEIGFSQSDGYEAGRYFINCDSMPTAICCANDEIALGLLASMQERGIRIPQEVSVTGMDDIPYARISNPSLTSVSNDSNIFAREGVRLLFERIEGIATGKPRDVIVRHDLIVRNSVCALKQESASD